MYSKIVNHYKQYLQKQKISLVQQNDQGSGRENVQNDESTESQEHSDEPEPIAGPSGLQSENEVDQQTKKDKMFNFLPAFSAVKVFENDKIEVLVQKSLHKRLKTFKMEDSVFHVKVKIKDNQMPPLLKDLLLVLEKAFNFILSNIRTFFFVSSFVFD